MPFPTRRKFLQLATLAGAAATVLSRRLLAASGSEQVNLGIIGCGWRGGQLLDSFSKLPNVRIAGLCDVDQDLLGEMGQKVPQANKWTDMRHMFDSAEIDAVVIATCNHWHCLAAIWAMEAGKHVYVEKPLGHKHWEGEQVVNASRKYDRICQVGTQQRSDPMQAEIKQFLHDEKILGEIESVRVNRFGVRKSIGQRPMPLVPPKNVDYNLWLGPAEDIPIYRDKLHYDWHWSWNTGSGEMGNWGVHILDDVRNNIFRDTVSIPTKVTAAGGRFAWNDAGDTPNAQFAVLETGKIPVVVNLCNLPTDKANAKIPGPSSGYIAYCAGGRLEGQRGKAAAFDAAGKLIKEFAGNGGSILHQQNFIDAIRADSSSRLAAPVQIGHDSTTWCNLINIATRMPQETSQTRVEDIVQQFGTESTRAIFEQVQGIVDTNCVGDTPPQLQLGPSLQFNKESQQFVGGNVEEANQMLRREDRKPFAVPEVKIS